VCRRRWSGSVVPPGPSRAPPPSNERSRSPKEQPRADAPARRRHPRCRPGVTAATTDGVRDRVAPINRVLAFAFLALLLGKLLFRPQLAAIGRWLDGLVNAMLIAIALAYTVQIIVVVLR